MFESLKRKSLSEKALYILVSIVFAAFAASYVYILVFLFVSGAKSHTEVIMEPFAMPEIWNWQNYVDVWTLLEVNDTNFFGMLIWSIWWSVIPNVINIFTIALFSYTCSKYKFPAARWPYYIIWVTVTLPIYGASGAGYKLNWYLGLIDNPLSVFIAFSAFNFTYMYFDSYYKNLSWTYAEAAQIDGANDYQIFFRVMLPQTMPILTALGINNWLVSWNDYGSQLVSAPNYPTLPTGIYMFSQEMTYRARMDILFAACFLVCIPCLIIFTVFNKTITTNVSIGGIKG